MLSIQNTPLLTAIWAMPVSTGQHSRALASFLRALAIENNDSLKIKSCLTLPVILGIPPDRRRRARLHAELARLSGEQLRVKDLSRAWAFLRFIWPIRHNGGHATRIGQLLRRSPVLEYTAPHCWPWPRKVGRAIKIVSLAEFYTRLASGI